MSVKIIYRTSEHEAYIRKHSALISSNTIARTLNIPASEVMNLIIVEKLKVPVKGGGRRKKVVEI